MGYNWSSLIFFDWAKIESEILRAGSWLICGEIQDYSVWEIMMFLFSYHQILKCIALMYLNKGFAGASFLVMEAWKTMAASEGMVFLCT